MTTAAQKPKALNIFDVIKQADNKNRLFYSGLTQKEQSTIAPMVLQRWMCSGSDLDVILINEYVNPYVFALAQHKELMWALLTVAGNPTKPRRSWNPGSKRQNNNALLVDVISTMLGCSPRTAQEYVPYVSLDTAIDAAEQLGWQSDQIKKLQTEIEKRDSKSKKTAGSIV